MSEVEKEWKNKMKKSGKMKKNGKKKRNGMKNGTRNGMKKSNGERFDSSLRNLDTITGSSGKLRDSDYTRSSNHTHRVMRGRRV